MDWVRNALAAVAGELARAEAEAIEKRRGADHARTASRLADEAVSNLEAVREALRVLLDPSEREVPY